MSPDEILVLEDALEERGWRRANQHPGLPSNWEFKYPHRTTQRPLVEAGLYWFSERVLRDGTVIPVEAYGHITVDRTRTRWRPAKEQMIAVRTFADAMAFINEVSRAVFAANASLESKRQPRVPPGLYRPEGLSDAGNLAYDVLLDFFIHNDLTYTGGIMLFHNPQEWAERTGNRYALGSELVVYYEGAEAQRAMSMDGEDYELNEAMQNALGEHGLYFEEGTSTYGGVYRR